MERHDQQRATGYQAHIQESFSHLANSMYRAQRHLATTSEVPEDVRTDLQADVCGAIMTLRPYRRHEAIDWEAVTPFDGGPDEILQRNLEGDVVEKTPDGVRGGEPEPTRVPARFAVEALLMTGHDLLDMARDLGFVAEPEPRNPPAGFGAEDLDSSPAELRPPER